MRRPARWPQIIATPQGAAGGDPDDDPDDDPLAALTSDIATAKGGAILLESTAAGWGEGPAAAPRKDFVPSRLGPSPAAASVELRRDTESSLLASCGMSGAMYDPKATGTGQREAGRRFYLSTLIPTVRMLEAELSLKLEAPVRLGLDLYSSDLHGRASSFARLVAGGVPIAEALATTGLLGQAETERD